MQNLVTQEIQLARLRKAAEVALTGAGGAEPSGPAQAVVPAAWPAPQARGPSEETRLVSDTGAAGSPPLAGSGTAASHGPIGNAVVYGRLPVAAYAGEVAIGDVAALLSAVKARLRRTVSEGTASALVQPALNGVQSIRSGVLECVAALDQIEATLARELERRDSLQMEISDTQSALAQALAELAGTQAGERYARHLAQHDSLTSLPNRGYFVERLDAELTSLAMRQHALAVLYLDLDDFKPINERYGQDTGDELLRIVGVRLSRSVRMDDMVCRLGGDEFACLLPDVQGRAQLASLATKLIQIVAAPLQVGKRKLTVHPSIGIALGPEHGNTSEDLLDNADQAMCNAKRQKSGFAFFDRAMGA